MNSFDYILDKIRQTDFETTPFKHLEINGLFEQSDFEQIISSPEIRLPQAASDRELFATLEDRGYRIIQFPGCTTSQKKYEHWHRQKHVARGTRATCEGFGVVLRLLETQSEIIARVKAFLESDSFIQCIAEKFGLAKEDCVYDAGIQKYLDGYEISPHPDIRRKALTYMVNINPAEDSESQDYHTSYLTLKEPRKYVAEYWRTNTDCDRDWVPWDWCEVNKQQRKNNSLVIFQPSHDMLHAVKAAYDHFGGQRTQMYGNLWFENQPRLTPVRWDELDIRPRQKSVKAALKSYMPSSVLTQLRNMKRRNKGNGQRRVT